MKKARPSRTLCSWRAGVVFSLIYQRSERSPQAGNQEQSLSGGDCIPAVRGLRFTRLIDLVSQNMNGCF